MAARTRRWRLYLLVFGFWTLLGIYFTVQNYLVISIAISERARGAKSALSIQQSISWGETLRLNLAEFYIWAVLTVFIFWLAKRFPFERGCWKTSLALHLSVSLFVAVAESAFSALLSEWLRKDFPKPSVSWAFMQLYFVGRFGQNMLFYWAVLGVWQALDYYRKYRNRELRASLLRSQLMQARLQVLKMQLHPHFLFNTLNAISALMHQDVELADRMVARLGELLRATLENADLQEVTLRQELEFIQPYLEIEKARLGPRLQVQMRVEHEALDGLVPNMLLQPLVENAIRHGVAPRAEPGSIEVSAHRENGTLRLRMWDDGPGIRMSTPPGLAKGLGLANTRARLQQLYGGASRLELSNGSSGGLEVKVTIPFRDAPEPLVFVPPEGQE